MATNLWGNLMKLMKLWSGSLKIRTHLHLLLLAALILTAFLTSLDGIDHNAVIYFTISTYVISFILMWTLLHPRTIFGVRVLVLVVSTISVLLIFANFYKALGIFIGDCKTTPLYNDAVYFSLVTFTTLGYGDMSPIPSMRIVAASEALLGYIYLGFLITMISSFIDRQDNG